MADDQEQAFHHESLQDTASIVRYLEALTEGLRSGAVSLKDAAGEVLLRPHGLIQFEVQASSKRDRRRLSLKFSWKAEDGAPRQRPLTIGGVGGGEEAESAGAPGQDGGAGGAGGGEGDGGGSGTP